jgi:hypothetical protein
MRVLKPFLPCLLLASSLIAAEKPPITASPLTRVAPNAALATYAAAHGIPLQGVGLAGEATAPQPGDTTVFLLSLQQPAGFRQWLVRLTTDTLKGAEMSPLKEDRIYTSTGLELVYSNPPAALNVEFIGPFDPVDAKTPVVTRSRQLVSAESLRIGMAQYCASSIGIAGRLQSAGIREPLFYGGGDRPPADVVAKGKIAAAAFGLTPDEERLAFSVFFSLRSFFEAATNIPAARAVLEQVMQKPSLWSLASNLGLDANFRYGWEEVRAVPANTLVPDSALHLMPVRLALNGKPAAKFTFAVTTTRPPLNNSAGIVALCAEHPTDASKRLFIQLLSARPAGASPRG